MRRAVVLLLAALPALPAELFVAPNGNDASPGTLAAPLATPQGAQRRARTLLAGGQPVTVTLRGGVYPLAQPLVFGGADSGTAAQPVTWQAYRSERPILDGGRRITGWRREGKLWAVTLPDVRAGKGSFNQLFVNGRRAQRARTPNEDYLTIAGYDAPGVGPQGQPVSRESTAFVYQPGDIQEWPNLEDAVVIVYHSWETSLLRIKTIDTQRHTVEFTGPAVWKFGYWGPGQRYQVENLPEALDAPGEWYLDRETGALSYYPLPGEDPQTADVYAPVTEELVRFVGESALGVPVEHITLRGLTLRHADWSLEPQGHSDPQAACTIGAAISLSGASHVSLENCDIAHVGRYAVWLRTGCRDCRIVHNQFHDLGAGAVRVGETFMANDPADQCGGHLIDNNWIHDYGNVFAAGVGIYVGQSSDNTITHNEIHDGNYSGMSIGWNWGSTPTQCHRNLVADNHIHHVMRGMLSDGAGIYTLGTSTGTILRHNDIHDVFSHASPPIAWGVYLDAETNGVTVENNLCRDTTSGGLMMHNGAHENVVRNNIFARGALQTVWRAKPVGKPAQFERNIVYVTQGNTFYYDADPDLASTWNHNLYWRADGREMVFNGGSWDEWLELGLDRDSLVADPQFQDPKHGDFRLKPTSPAITKLGFQPFDVSDCGLHGEPEWVALPRQARFAPTVLPQPGREEALGQGLDDGFETTAVGQPPAGAVVYLGEIPGGHVAVSAEQAAAGQRSLKLTDAPGLKNNWDPHCFYQPNAGRGTIVLGFKVWIGTGAMPWIELRDGANPYHAGPSLQLGPGDLLMANGRPTLKLPREQWVGVDLTCGLGKEATGSYDLTLSVPGAPAQRFAAIPCHPEFKRLTWFGFVSLATDTAAFYVDDVKLEVRR